MIRVKPGVTLDNSHHRMFLVAALAAPIWAKYGSPDLWITGGNEDGHSKGPRGFHRLPDGTCQAWDLRTWSIPELEHRKQACAELAGILGELYDVMYEKPGERGEHAHVQWDPGRPGTRV
jgi:hypothetical protein